MNMLQSLNTYEAYARQSSDVSTAELRNAVTTALRIVETSSTPYGRVPMHLRPKDASTHKTRWALKLRLALRDGTRKELALALDEFWHLVHSGELEPTPFNPMISEKLDRLLE